MSSLLSNPRSIIVDDDDMYMVYSRERLIRLIQRAVRKARRNDCVLEGYVMFGRVGCCYQTVTGNTVRYFYDIDSEDSFASRNLDNLSKKDLIYLIYNADSMDLLP